jgi:hypothetical protein
LNDAIWWLGFPEKSSKIAISIQTHFLIAINALIEGCKMAVNFSRIFFVPYRRTSVLAILLEILFLKSGILQAQTKVEIYHHNSTAEGDILRARADAVVALSQSQLIHEQAVAQRLENMIRECDVAYKRFSTRNQMEKERREHQFEMIFDSIKFNQQLADIRKELELKIAMEHPGTGDLTDEMNLLLKNFTQNSFDKNTNAAMKTELSPEQLQAICLSDGSNTFTGTGGRTRLDTFSWPFILKMKVFDADRAEFEELYQKAMKEIEENKNPSPETVIRLLEKKSDIEKKVDSIKLSSKADLQTTEMKWRSEAKNYLRELNQTLDNYSNHDSERLKKYIFKGKTLGDLLQHMVANGLRFAHPKKEDSNLYASIFFLMRYAIKEVSPAKSFVEQEKSNDKSKGPLPPVPASNIREQTKVDAQPNVAAEKKISLFAPYPEKYTPQHPNNQISLQYAVMAICDQAGLQYDWNNSAKNTDPIRRQWVRPQFHDFPWQKAMSDLLSPLGLTYEVNGNTVVLKRK